LSTDEGQQNLQAQRGVSESVEPAPPDVAEATYTAIRAHIGPLPPPEVLARYERLLPGSAERLFQMVERDQTHRFSLEHKIVDREARVAMMGQVFGLLVALAVLAVAIVAIQAGNATAGAALSAVDIVGLAGVFVAGRWRGGRMDE
jgi:uncharacterized membrane protein